MWSTSCWNGPFNHENDHHWSSRNHLPAIRFRIRWVHQQASSSGNCTQWKREQISVGQAPRHRLRKRLKKLLEPVIPLIYVSYPKIPIMTLVSSFNWFFIWNVEFNALKKSIFSLFLIRKRSLTKTSCLIKPFLTFLGNSAFPKRRPFSQIPFGLQGRALIFHPRSFSIQCKYIAYAIFRPIFFASNKNFSLNLQFVFSVFVLHADKACSSMHARKVKGKLVIPIFLKNNKLPVAFVLIPQPNLTLIGIALIHE